MIVRVTEQGTSPNEPRTARSGGQRSLLRRLTAGHRLRMASLAGSSFLSALLEAGFLVLLTTTVVALAAQEDSIGPVLGITLPVSAALGVASAALVIRLLLSLVTVQLSSGLSARVRSQLRSRVAHEYLAASWTIQQTEVAGRLQELLSSFVWRVTNSVAALATGITALLSLVAFLATSLGVNAPATLAVLGVLGALAAVLTPVRRRIRRRSAEASVQDLAYAGAVAELGSLGQEMQTFGVRRQFIERLDDLSEVTTESQRHVQRLQGSLAPLYTTFAYSAVLLGLGALSVIGVSDVSTAGAVTLLMLRSLSYGQQLLAVSGTLASSLPFVEKLDDAIATYAANRASGGDQRPPAVTPLELAEVSFSYDADRVALTDVSARIHQGEVIGVVGPSGAGKSTLAQLLLGVREPSAGAVLVDGVDLRTVDREWWTRHVAFVPQDALLITGTVADNIRFFRDFVEDDAIIRACTQANLVSHIEALPHGYDTHLGERGSELSGGQRQRLSIARALAGSPELLVLDEPTSALDGQSESLIRDTVTDLRGRITVVIIAHRMSTLDMCDRIMVVEGGRMTAIGTPEVVRERNPFFRKAMAIAGLD